VLAGIALAVAGFFVFDLGRYPSWEALRDHRAALGEQVERHFAVALLVFFAVYVAVAALSLPGAAVLTLAAGALFGRWWGTGVVSLASTAGATLAFLLTRYLFRAFVQERWGHRLEPINRGVEADGAYYLFTLRLVPVVPFFLINAAMGLTRLPVRTFWWVSQLGMLPGTFLYVNAGTELAQIASPKDALSPTVLVSLALLGVVPLLFRQILRWRKDGRAIGPPAP
jgi:uncharacterized membrane protein YdjX (TVP38/TMEM64 family)